MANAYADAMTSAFKKKPKDDNGAELMAESMTSFYKEDRPERGPSQYEKKTAFYEKAGFSPEKAGQLAEARGFTKPELSLTNPEAPVDTPTHTEEIEEIDSIDPTEGVVGGPDNVTNAMAQPISFQDAAEGMSLTGGQPATQPEGQEDYGVPQPAPVPIEQPVVNGYQQFLDNEDEQHKAVDEQFVPERKDLEEKRIEEEEKLNNARDAYDAMEVDPQRYFKNQSTWSKVLAVIGTAMLGYVGKGGQALEMIQKTVDNDVAAQKAELMKGGAKIKGHENMLAKLNGQFKDLDTSALALKSIQTKKIANQIQAYANQQKDEDRKLQYNQKAQELHAASTADWQKVVAKKSSQNVNALVTMAMYSPDQFKEGSVTPQQIAMTPGVSPENIKRAQEMYLPEIGVYARNESQVQEYTKMKMEHIAMDTSLDRVEELYAEVGALGSTPGAGAVLSAKRQELKAESIALMMRVRETWRLGVISKTDYEQFLAVAVPEDPAAAFSVGEQAKWSALRNQNKRAKATWLEAQGFPTAKKKRHDGLMFTPIKN